MDMSATAARARAGRTAALAAAALILAACGRVPGVYVVVHPSGAGGAAAIVDGGGFNAQQYVDGIWSSQVLPAYRGRAVAAPTLISALTANTAKACTQYGNVAAQDSACAFMVKGTGRITGVTSSLSGTELSVELPPYNGSETVAVDVGPAFTGTAVRDALPSIKFSQYVNQVDYAEVGIQLNALVRERVIGGATFTGDRGHTVTFTGATEGSDPKAIAITPVSLSVGPS
jgi:predicted lipoprotein